MPPSVDHAKAWLDYARFLFHAEGHGDARRAALTRGLEVAEAAGATGIAAGIQVNLAHDACLRGQVAEGFAMVERARALADASGDGEALVEVAGDESDILLKTGRFDRGRRGRAARRAGGPRVRAARRGRCLRRREQRGRGDARPRPHGRGGTS